jgi:fumarate hydratase class II
MKKNSQFRIETDAIGKVRIPIQAHWGIQTQRALENFPKSGLTFSPQFMQTLALVKFAAAQANLTLNLLDKEIGNAILQAAREIMDGKWDDQFQVDIFQTGSGTSSHMNMNEVIASRANEILGGRRGDRSPVHPNDHVNLAQSSNDVIPSCIHISAYRSIQQQLIPVINELGKELIKKADEFDSVIKLGRTHLQDATPVRLGQEFRGYATMVIRSIERIKNSSGYLLELALGGTAVGTGINRDPRFPALAIKNINRLTGFDFREAENHFEAQGARDAMVQVSSTLKMLAVSLTKIANDIRWMGSGPKGGLGELMIPVVQPGSSIMPGKVNPVIAESLLQVAAQVMGNDLVLVLGGQSGNFELNTMMPVMAYNLLHSIDLLANGVGVFNRKLIRHLRADEKRCRELAEKSMALVTFLTPEIGYDRAAAVVREVWSSGKSLKTIILEKGMISQARLEKLLDIKDMTEPRK